MTDSLSKNIKSQPYIFHIINSTSLLLAKEIRKEFIHLTDDITLKYKGKRTFSDGSQKFFQVNPPTWKDVKGEIACFIDGGVGQKEFFTKIPLIIRSGIFRVITGERNLDEREKFEIYPMLVGELEQVKKESQDYIAVTRIIIELLSSFKVIEDPDYDPTDILISHGPLIHRLSQYSGHYIGETDLIHILNNTGSTNKIDANKLLNGFRQNCNSCQHKSERCEKYRKNQILMAVCFIQYVFELIFTRIKENSNKPLLYGVVERSRLKEYSKILLLPEIFLNYPDMFKDYQIALTGDLFKDTKKLLDKTNYHDALLLSLILEEGEFTKPFMAEEPEVFTGFKSDLDFMGKKLQDTIPFKYSYLKVKSNTFPIRIEFPAYYKEKDIETVINRAYMYSRLLPNYAFPIGLDIVDKFAKVPQWMTDAFTKLISVKLSIEASHQNLEEFKQLMGIILMQKRDWLYRPKII